MKKINLILIAILFAFVNAYAQTDMWGMTYEGGTDTLGVIFKVDSNGNNQQVMYNFKYEYPGGSPQYSQLCEANGQLYGLTTKGGIYNKGVLYEYNPTTNTYIKRVDFDGTNKGSTPQGSLILATNGKLYGTTPSGGTNDRGVIFEYNLNTNIFTKLIDFDGTNKGSTPCGELTQATNSLIYGLTYIGGSQDRGVLFEFNPNTNTLIKKYDFILNTNNGNGYSPTGKIIQATNGKLYGLTSSGGSATYGALFEYNLTTNSYKTRYSFLGTNGFGPSQNSLSDHKNIKYHSYSHIQHYNISKTNSSCC